MFSYGAPLLPPPNSPECPLKCISYGRIAFGRIFQVQWDRGGKKVIFHKWICFFKKIKYSIGSKPLEWYSTTYIPCEWRHMVSLVTQLVWTAPMVVSGLLPQAYPNGHSRLAAQGHCRIAPKEGAISVQKYLLCTSLSPWSALGPLSQPFGWPEDLTGSIPLLQQLSTVRTAVSGLNWSGEQSIKTFRSVASWSTLPLATKGVLLQRLCGHWPGSLRGLKKTQHQVASLSDCCHFYHSTSL